jgi:hypothetical protein
MQAIYDAVVALTDAFCRDHLTEPLRVCRRLFGLSHAAKAISCN